MEKKLRFYSISTLNRYKFLLKSRQFPFEVSVPERLFQCDISTWINLRLNCSAMFELKRKKTIYAGSWPRACFYAFMNREEVEIVPKFQNLKVCLAIFFIIGQDQNSLSRGVKMGPSSHSGSQTEHWICFTGPRALRAILSTRTYNKICLFYEISLIVRSGARCKLSRICGCVGGLLPDPFRIHSFV